MITFIESQKRGLQWTLRMSSMLSNREPGRMLEHWSSDCPHCFIVCFLQLVFFKTNLL